MCVCVGGGGGRGAKIQHTAGGAKFWARMINQTFSVRFTRSGRWYDPLYLIWRMDFQQRGKFGRVVKIVGTLFYIFVIVTIFHTIHTESALRIYWFLHHTFTGFPPSHKNKSIRRLPIIINLLTFVFYHRFVA